MVDEMCLSDAMLSGAEEVFKTMIFMDIKESNESKEIENEAILGSITFQGGMEGCLSIRCDIPCAKAIAVNMLAMEPDAELGEEEISDAFGEVANMVMGSVKSRILPNVGDLDISIPTVIKGQKLNSSLGDGANKVLTKVDIANEYIAELTIWYRQ
jgi:CheY-specific phosphatase CheX